MNAQTGLDLPHQVGTDAKTSNLASQGSVLRFVKVIAAIQPDIRIEPVIVFRKRFAELRVQSSRKILCEPLHGRANDSVHRGATSVPYQMQRIYPCAQSGFFRQDK